MQESNAENTELIKVAKYSTPLCQPTKIIKLVLLEYDTCTCICAGIIVHEARRHELFSFGVLSIEQSLPLPLVDVH